MTVISRATAITVGQRLPVATTPPRRITAAARGYLISAERTNGIDPARIAPQHKYVLRTHDRACRSFPLKV